MRTLLGIEFHMSFVLVFQIAWVYKTVNVMTELKTIQQKRKASRENKKSQ